MSAGSIFQFQKMLKNLDQCMTKAAAYADHKKFDINVLVNYRLAPDMYSFGEQIQSACDAAKFCAAYLSGQTAPKHEDNEATWKELHERVGKVVSYLETFKKSDFDKMSSIQAKPVWAQGQWLTGDEYLEELAIPNFYFHLTTAYALMRHVGVDIGKTDFIGNLNFKK